MTFSKEDRAAWNDSLVMHELEKIAKETDILNDFSEDESYLPIDFENDENYQESWEDEDLLEKASDELLGLEEEDNELQISEAYLNMTLSKLYKIANHLADNSKMNATLRVERTIHNIKSLLKVEGK